MDYALLRVLAFAGFVPAFSRNPNEDSRIRPLGFHRISSRSITGKP